MKTQLRKIGWITFAWTLLSILQYLIVLGGIIDLGLFTETLNPWLAFVVNVATGVIAGLIGGSAIVFLWEKWLRSKPYGWTLKSIFITYCVVFLIVSLSNNLLYQSDALKVSIISYKLWAATFQRIFTLVTFIPFFTWLFILLSTIIVMLVNDKYGPGVFRKFLMGKYFNPQREERVFMFLDLRSSTTIAESLGEERYFSFLRDVFQFATPAILTYKAEIYQYVGDEMVVSWELDAGIHNANCIRCYFEIQKALNEHHEYFQEHFGVFPEFKAGIHYGYVMAGEIGVVKREIAYSGDVLNTTARIQSLCNELRSNVLITSDLKNILPKTSFSFVKKGLFELRGRNQKEELFQVQLN